jgi:hypothetical protein
MENIWTSSSGRIELNISEGQAAIGYHSGDCAEDIGALAHNPKIAAQLAALDPAIVAAALKEYGAWNSVELSDHEANLKRLLWIACGDIAEGLNND